MAPFPRLALTLGLLVNSAWTVDTILGPGSPKLLQKYSNICPMSNQHEMAPIPPKDDSWYITTPNNLAAAAPGTILRVRQAPGNLTAVVPGSSNAYNIIYRTTDSQYQPTYAVATLFIPRSNNGTNSSRATLLSYTLPYDAVDLNLSPSYSM